MSRVLTTMFQYMLLQALEGKSNSLHEQRMHQLALERECSRLRLELERLRELQPVLHGELLCYFHTSTMPCQVHTAMLAQTSIRSEGRHLHGLAASLIGISAV